MRPTSIATAVVPLAAVAWAPDVAGHLDAATHADLELARAELAKAPPLRC